VTHGLLLIGGLVAGTMWLLGAVMHAAGRANRGAIVVGSIGGVLARLLGACVLAWSAVDVLGDRGVVPIVLSVVLAVLALWMFLSGGLILYALARTRGNTSAA